MRFDQDGGRKERVPTPSGIQYSLLYIARTTNHYPCTTLVAMPIA